jgi:hypothetical protein
MTELQPYPDANVAALPIPAILTEAVMRERAWGRIVDHDWVERRYRREQRFTQLLGEGLLARPVEQLRSIQEVAEFVAVAYWAQRRRRCELPQSLARPDSLVERTIELTGDCGIRDSQLRAALKPLSSKRLERALARLRAGGRIELGREACFSTGGPRQHRIWRIA